MGEAACEFQGDLPRLFRPPLCEADYKELPGRSGNGRGLGNLAVVVTAWETLSPERIRKNARSTWERGICMHSTLTQFLEVLLHSDFIAALLNHVPGAA